MDGAHGEAFWRARAEQLQHALTSRIVVEQAKGVLGERLGLDMPGAFEVLRYAARSSQTKLHELAQDVVEGEETPHAVVQAIARHHALLTRAPRAKRIEQTERLFRAINDELARQDGNGQVDYVCECGNPLCAERISLTVDVLGRLHAEKDLYVVLAGHEIPDVESIVAQENGYVFVRKAR
jgi:hypothetical protein